MSDEYEYEEEEEEEEYIDPKDLIIINNSYGWNPSEKQIKAYARQLEFDLDKYPEVLQIAKNYLTQKLPDTWRRAFTKDNMKLIYIDTSTNEIHLSTEIEETAKEEYLNFIKENEEKKKEESMKHKKVPNIKVPPIGKNKVEEDENRKKEKEIMKNLRNTVDKEKMEEDEDMKNLREKMERDNKKEKEKEDEKATTFYIDKNYDDNMSSDGSKVIRIDELNDIKNSCESEIDEEEEEEESEKDYSKHIKGENLRNNVKGKKESEEGSENEENEEKEESEDKEEKKQNDTYLNRAQNNEEKSQIESSNSQISREKSSYKTKAKSQYQSEKEKIKSDLYNIKQKYKDEYKTQLSIEKTKIQEEYNQRLNKLKDQLEQSNKRKLESYKEDIINDYNLEQYNTLENEINRLNIEREKLQSKAENLKNKKLKKQREKKESSNTKILESKYYIDETKKLKLDEIYRQFDNKVSQIESEYEIDFNKQKNKIDQHLKESQAKLRNHETSISNNLILREYEKNLNERYENDKNKIKKEFESKKENDIETFKNTSFLESKEKVNFYNKEISNLEKEHFASVSEIRNKNESMRSQSANELRDKINSITNLFEMIKKDMITALSNEISEITINIQHFIRTDQGEKTEEQIEEKIEEYINNRVVDKSFKMQKLRMLYEILESDYRKNTIKLRYFIDINSYVTKAIVENPFTNEEIDEQSTFNKVSNAMINDIMRFSKEKVNEYKIEFNKIKDTKLFSFIDIYLNKSQSNNNNNLSMTLDSINNINNNYSNYNSNLNNTFTRNNNNLFTTSHQKFSTTETLNSFHFSPSKHNTQFSRTNFGNNFRTNKPQPQMEPQPQTSTKRNFLSPTISRNTFSVHKPNEPQNQASTRYKNIVPLIKEQFEPLPTDTYQQIPISIEKTKAKEEEQFNQSNQSKISITRLPKDLLTKLSDEEFTKYSKIIDFIKEEENIINYELKKLNHKKNVSLQLEEMNESGLNLAQVLNDQKMQTMRSEKIFNSKAENFNIIKELIDDSFNFILENSNRKNLANDKFDIIVKNIEKYKKTKDIDIKGKGPLSIKNEMGFSFNIKPQKKTNELKLQNINVNNINNNYNAFSDFYSIYTPNSLNRNFITDFSHQFFNEKKNREFINYRIIGNSNYNSTINPSKQYAFGKTFY